jgi:hypothetical protein
MTHFPARLDVEWLTWGVQMLLVDGGRRGLFTLLFGAFMLPMLGRAEASSAPINAWAP